jgi:hypothetical protein
MPHGVHAKDQTAFRFPPGVLPRLKAQAEMEGRTMTDIVVGLVTGYLDQSAGITTRAVPAEPVSPPPTPIFVAAEDEQPEPAQKNCKHRNMRSVKGVCPDCQEWVSPATSRTNGEQ